MTHISIVGMGSVGTAVASSLLGKGLVSKLSMFDLHEDKALGEALDFMHAGSLIARCELFAGSLDSACGGDICIVAAGVKSRPGESRLALLERNLVAAEQVATALEREPLPKVLIVLTNPVDIITEYFRRRFAPSGVNVFGSGTSLDSQRLRERLASHLQVGAASVHAWVVGEHGDSSVCLLDSARVGCMTLADFAQQRSLVWDEHSRRDIQSEVRTGAQQVINLKGATAHAIGLTTAALAKAVMEDERIVVPVSVGVRPGVCASVPCVIDRRGVAAILEPEMSEHERAQFSESLLVLTQACGKISRDFP